MDRGHFQRNNFFFEFLKKGEGIGVSRDLFDFLIVRICRKDWILNFEENLEICRDIIGKKIWIGILIFR